MYAYDGGQWVVGRDRAIGQNADRLCAKRTLDMDLVGGDIGQVRFRNGSYQLERIGAAPRQRFGGQRQRWPLRKRIAQFGVDKFDCAHGWQPRPLVAKQNGKAVTAWRQVRVDKRPSCCGLVVTLPCQEIVRARAALQRTDSALSTASQRGGLGCRPR